MSAASNIRSETLDEDEGELAGASAQLHDSSMLRTGIPASHGVVAFEVFDYCASHQESAAELLHGGSCGGSVFIESRGILDGGVHEQERGRPLIHASPKQLP